MSKNTVVTGDNTSDVNLMAALAVMKVNADTACVQSRGKITRVWTLDSESFDGKWKTRDLLKWWNDETFEDKNPDHVFGKLKAALRIRRDIVDGIKKDKPLAFVQHGDSLAVIHPDCSAETEDKILGGIA